MFLERCKRVLEAHQVINDLDDVISSRQGVTLQKVVASEVNVPEGVNLLGVLSVRAICELESLCTAVINQKYFVLRVDHNIVKFNIRMHEASFVDVFDNI